MWRAPQNKPLVISTVRSLSTHDSERMKSLEAQVFELALTDLSEVRPEILARLLGAIAAAVTYRRLRDDVDTTINDAVFRAEQSIKSAADTIFQTLGESL